MQICFYCKDPVRRMQHVLSFSSPRWIMLHACCRVLYQIRIHSKSSCDKVQHFFFQSLLGCQFTTGSWQWHTSWRWDTKDDALMVLDNDRDYGIATGFNVTTTEYHSCSVVSVNYWVEKMNWNEASDDILNSSKPVMFRLHNMWHFSWVIPPLIYFRFFKESATSVCTPALFVRNIFARLTCEEIPYRKTRVSITFFKMNLPF